MLTRRIIPCLDVSHGRVVKGINFQGLRDAGDPVELAAAYEAQGADEIVILDVSATPEGRATQADTVRKVREVLSIPLTVGGGIRSAEAAGALLDAGADKVAVNTAAVARPELLRELATRFGTQCTVLSVDAQRAGDGTFRTLVRSGADDSGREVMAWTALAVSLGVGEILLTSWDRDGTRSGYDLELTAQVCQAVQVPVIASGGAAHAGHLLEALEAGADAVLAASIFHDAELTVMQVKDFLAERGVEVRR